MTFRIRGLDPAAFSDFRAMDELSLEAMGSRRYVINEANAAPCRITLEDAEIGETVLLLGWHHQKALTPYNQNGPIFVRQDAETAWDSLAAIPPSLERRLLSVRGFDRNGYMIDAEIVEGPRLTEQIATFWANDQILYLQAHFARRGCFAATIKRA
jgi:hypothetical protein